MLLWTWGMHLFLSCTQIPSTPLSYKTYSTFWVLERVCLGEHVLNNTLFPRGSVDITRIALYWVGEDHIVRGRMTHPLYPLVDGNYKILHSMDSFNAEEVEVLVEWVVFHRLLKDKEHLYKYFTMSLKHLGSCISSSDFIITTLWINVLITSLK